MRFCSLQIRRPNNYEPDVCIMLGPPDADPTMDLTALDIVKTVVLDSPNKLFVGGLPCDWTEEQVGDGMGTPFHLLSKTPQRSSKVWMQGLHCVTVHEAHPTGTAALPCTAQV